MTPLLRMFALAMAVLTLAGCDRGTEPTPATTPTHEAPTMVNTQVLSPNDETVVSTPAIMASETPPLSTLTETSSPPSTERPAGAPSGRCGELCTEGFWQGDVSVASVQAELDRDPDLTAESNSGFTPLHWAAYRRVAPEIIRLLLDHDADASAKADDGTPVLTYALLNRNSPEVVIWLLESGADATARDAFGRTPLHEAVTYAAHDPETLRSLLDDGIDLVKYAFEIVGLLLEHGADAAARDDHGQSVLFIYLANLIESESYDADPRVVKLLLENGADGTMENDAGALVMTYAMWAAANPEVIMLLLKHGVDVKARGAFDWTALHLSVRNGDIDPQVIRLLLDNGADVAARSDNGATPLHHAATHSGPEVVRMLLERGADVAALDDLLNTPLHTAMTDGYSGPTDYSPDPGVIRLLLENGADVNARNHSGSTPLLSAAGHQLPDAAELLLAQGADATARNDFRITPLHAAAGAGAFMTVTLLLNHGADTSAPDHTLRTPLHWAAGPLFRSPSPDTVALLLEGGAAINAVDQAGDTPLHLAAKLSEPWHDPPTVEVIRLLLAHGADTMAANNDGKTACDVVHADDESTRALLCP